MDETIKENKKEEPKTEDFSKPDISSFNKESFKGNDQDILRVKDIHKKFFLGGNEVEVLKGINLNVIQGEFAVLMGPSGCGKSTLLHAIYGLEQPTSGEVFIDGQEIWGKTKNWRAHFRNENVGFIPQQAFWVRSLSVLENIAIPSFISGNGYKESIEKAYQMIRLIKMENWAHYRPFDLSGGQQQRIAFARAMILNPKFIIADEPTGNLDVKTGDYLMGLIQDFNEQFGVSVLVVTHNEDQVKYAKRVIRMLDGQVISNEIREK